MKLIKEICNKEHILLGVFFVLFVLSYTTNLFHISDPNIFHGFERQPEGLVVGRLARSAQDGVFSYGGLNGINYNSQTERSTEQYAIDLAAQHNIYLTNQELPDSYQAYKSQSGGQGLVFGVLQKISPFNHAQNLMFFRGLNALLIALAFCIFGWWILNVFGFITSTITLLFIFLSPWINVFSHNLWWVLWSFYLPFLVMTVTLWARHKHPDKLSYSRILMLLFVAVFLKCFFTGFEFITTTLAAAFCPIVFYFYLEQKTLKRFLIFSVKVSITMILAVLAQMLLLVIQIKSLEGNFASGINHIISSFTKRTATESASHLDVIKMYLQDDAFAFGFSSNQIHLSFGFLLLIIATISLFLYLKSSKIKNKTLALTSLFSILSPLSWLIIFKQHAYEHPHMDYIVWYIPFLPYGFCLLGLIVSKILLRCKKGRIRKI